MGAECICIDASQRSLKNDYTTSLKIKHSVCPLDEMRTPFRHSDVAVKAVIVMLNGYLYKLLSLVMVQVCSLDLLIMLQMC